MYQNYKETVSLLQYKYIETTKNHLVLSSYPSSQDIQFNRICFAFTK